MGIKAMYTSVVSVRKTPLLLLAVWLLAMAAGMFVAKPAAAASGPVSGNTTCKSLLNNQTAYEIKVETREIENGAKYDPITFKNVNSTKTLLGFDSTVRVKGVFVKGGPEGGYFYDYRLPNPPGGSLSDTNMGTNGYGGNRYEISHVSFCWDEEPAFPKVNHPPVAQPDSYDVDEDGTLEVGGRGVLGNDTDPEGDQITAELLSAPSNGTLTLRPDGSFTYTPNKDFNGPDTFTYEVCDAQGECDTATVTVNVTPTNDAPVVRDDFGSTAAAAAASNAFVSQYASSTASTPTRLFKFDTTHSPYTFDQVGRDIARPMNAIGYRSTDRMIYGYRMIDSPGIVKVNPTTGAARFLGNPVGLPASKNYIAGDVSPDGSTYYLYANKSGVLQRVNLTTFRARSVKLSSVIDVADLAVSPTDGNLYGVNSGGKLLKINPTTGRVTARSVVGLKPGTYGAAWFTAQGNLIAYENGYSLAHGTMTWIARPTTTAPSVVGQQAGPSTRGNDGAAYVAPPNPAGLSVVVDVLANDGDPDGVLDRNTLRIVQPPVSGTVKINADETITYTSGSSYRGTDSFRYEVCDNGAPQQCATATANITSAPLTSVTSPAASQKE